jgi:Fis family transcriptional regulator
VVKTTNNKNSKPGSSKHLGSAGKSLATLTDEALQTYFHSLNGHRPGALYDLVIGEVEKPLFRAVLNYTDGNQSRAAEILGINRGTLRKKLRDHRLTN